MSIAYLLVLAIVFAASLLGPLCGIGGGVIIKPVVDALGVMDVATVSFLSSASVLTMALATLAQNAVARTSSVCRCARWCPWRSARRSAAWQARRCSGPWRAYSALPTRSVRFRRSCSSSCRASCSPIR